MRPRVNVAGRVNAPSLPTYVLYSSPTYVVLVVCTRCCSLHRRRNRALTRANSTKLWWIADRLQSFKERQGRVSKYYYLRGATIIQSSLRSYSWLQRFRSSTYHIYAENTAKNTYRGRPTTAIEGSANLPHRLHLAFYSTPWTAVYNLFGVKKAIQ
jgi:hypothetical protein